MNADAQQSPWPRRRARAFEVIFGAETRAGKAYDIGLILVVTLSVMVVMLDSVSGIRASHEGVLSALEWGFTALFTIEYLVRLWCAKRPVRYALSFFGIVDFLGVIPTYLSLLVPGSQYLAAIRFLRVLRTFRVLKLSSYEDETRLFITALKQSRRRLIVFLFVVLTLVVVLGSLMYVVEDAESGFTSIPTSIYWAIVTLTTVAYGDISPSTWLGQAIAAVIMIIGYSIIVVPTGIVTVAVADAARSSRPGRRCPGCGAGGHEADAVHCRHCGAKLPANAPAQPGAD